MERKAHATRLKALMVAHGETANTLARKDRRIRARQVEGMTSGRTNGARSGPMLEAIADVLGVSIDLFTTRTGVDGDGDEELAS